MNKAAILTLLITFSVNASINVGTYNIRNFDYDSRSRTSTNKPYLAETLKSMKSDILAVQEINKKEVFKQMVQDELGRDFQAFLTECGGSHKQSLGFVINTKKFEVIDFKEDLRTVNVNSQRSVNCGFGSRPLAVVRLKHKERGTSLAAVAVHFKSGGKPSSIEKRFKQLARMVELTDELKSNGFENIIILGDFNTTEFTDRSGAHRKKFLQTLTSAQLKNETLSLTCTSYWWGNVDDQYYYPSHLDHIVTGGKIQNLSKPTVHGHCAQTACKTSHEATMGVSFDEVSDHCPITIKLAL